NCSVVCSKPAASSSCPRTSALSYWSISPSPYRADHAKRAEAEQQMGGGLGNGRGEEAVVAVSIVVPSYDLARGVDPVGTGAVGRSRVRHVEGGVAAIIE